MDVFEQTFAMFEKNVKGRGGRFLYQGDSKMQSMKSKAASCQIMSNCIA